MYNDDCKSPGWLCPRARNAASTVPGPGEANRDPCTAADIIPCPT